MQLHSEIIDYFREDINKLGALTKRDLSHWTLPARNA